MADHILVIGSCGWTMTIDLDEVAAEAGVRKRERWQDADGSWHYSAFVEYTLARARRLINLILEYASEEDLRKVDEAFQGNEKLYKIWKEKAEPAEGMAVHTRVHDPAPAASKGGKIPPPC